MDRRFASILAVVFLVFLGFFIFNKNSDSTKSSTSTGTEGTHHLYGNNSKGVTLLEYGDYECPVCGVYFQPLNQVVQAYKDQIHFQFKNLPLSAIHTNAFAAARAAEAAGLQGKYWEMHDLLYQNQNIWGESDTARVMFEDFAKQLGLDVNKFKTDYASQQVNSAINADLAAFKKTGQSMATPTFFVNGKYVPNTEFSDQSGPSAQKISDFLKAEISKSKK